MWVGWILSGFSIAGAILNAKMNKWGFVFWIVANVGWIGYNWLTHTYEQIPIWAVFTITSTWGYWKWYTNEEEEEEGYLPKDEL